MEAELAQTCLLRIHTGTDPFERVIVTGLPDLGVPLKKRSMEHQRELELHWMKRKGIRVFGQDKDLQDCGIVLADLDETYGFVGAHVLDMDEIYEEENPYRLGERVIVCSFGLGAPKIQMPDIIVKMLRWSFECRVYANLRDERGIELHSVELRKFKFQQRPMQFARRRGNLWFVAEDAEPLCA